MPRGFAGQNSIHDRNHKKIFLGLGKGKILKRKIPRGGGGGTRKNKAESGKF